MNGASKRPFFEDDAGFSTVGMVLALLISLSLLIGASQVYAIKTSTASVQNVADACALAAENQVASFYIVAQVCDSAIFSMSLAGTAVLGLGVVAACVPPIQAISTELIRVGKNILEARSRFAASCKEGLNSLQSLLPIFAALDAAALAQANGWGQASYYGFAILLPLEGLEIEAADSSAEDNLLSEIDSNAQTIAQAAQEAENACEAANQHKQRAYMADCGNAPGYCMHERAQRLAGMAGRENPQYASVDTWSFSVALNRAKTYYALRYAQEGPLENTVDEQARSAIRKRFYAYALDCMDAAYVYETADSFEAYFPLLPRNTEQMRQTRLYTEIAYLLTQNEEGKQTLHAYPSCPQALQEQFVGYSSIAEMEAAGLQKCAVCEFGASSVGKVAAASTSIENGFEYHYCIVAEQAALYEKEYARYAQQAQAAKNPIEELLETLKRALLEAQDCRIHVQPPGHFGAIAVVVQQGGALASSIIPNSLVAAAPSLGSSVAISAATLACDNADEANTTISSLVDGLMQDSIVVSAVGGALNIWSGFLVAYSKGAASLGEAIEDALNRLPIVGASGLGTWAAQKLQQTIETAGLAPPNVVSYKPVVVNTYYVASADSSAFSRGLLGAKQALNSAYGGIAPDALSAAIGIAAGKLLQSYESWDATFVVARIELFGEDGVSVPVEITMPPAIKEAGAGFLEQAFTALLSLSGSLVQVQRWE